MSASAPALKGRCPRCGALQDPESAEGLCPRCLVAMNLTMETDAPTGDAPPEERAAVRPRPATPPLGEIAQHFPQLEILECLGRGGMGVVYRARQPQLNRLVALKILAPEKEKGAEFAERFAREARALARLSHQNIVTIYDFGKLDGLYYLLMEHVDGVSLRQLLQAKQITPEEALAIVPRICEALQYAHEHGVVHRDIKPENILLNREGQVKIADFGIAKVTGAGLGQPTITREQQVIGTAPYMAPEQVEHPERVDHRADIYSLGVVFYEMLTGELPLGNFAAPSCKVQIDVRLDEVVLKALEKEPTRRYQGAGLLKTDVENITGTRAGEKPVTKATASRGSRAFSWYGIAFGGLGVTFGLAMWLFVPRATGDASQLAREGWQLWQEGRVEEAREKFSQAIKLEPEAAEPWNGLAWSNLRAGNHQEAEKAFQKVLSFEPDHGAALNGLGMLYFAQKKYGLAETNLLLAARTAPAARYGLAQLYLLEGKFEEAEKWARSIIAEGEEDELVAEILQAAREKRVSEELRVRLELQ